MKLSYKMLLFNLLAKGSLLLLFLLAGPYFLGYITQQYTDNQLEIKKQQVLDIVSLQGIGSFIYEDDSVQGFGSYNLLKEEYILLEKMWEGFVQDTIYTEERIIDGEGVTYRVRAMSFEEDGHAYLLEIGRSLQTILLIKKEITRLIIYIFLSFLLISFFLDYGFTEKLVQPFKAILKNKIAQIHVPQQFPYEPIATKTTEYQQLDEAITNMMQRLQKAFNQERVFISHASHELKTPISILQTQLETLISRPDLSEEHLQKLAEMQASIQRFKKIVNSLLLLSKVNNAQFIKTEEVALDHLLRDLVEEWKEMAAEKGIALVLETLTPFTFTKTNESLLHILFQNVILNAIKYCRPGDEIRISCTKESEGFKISIKDNGPGISADLLQQVREGQVFLKDARQDKSGFGLQIIHKIALYLNIQLSIMSNAEGTEIRFEF